MRDAIYDLLSDDATLMATLTGGLYQASEISRQTTADAFDANGEIEPCGLLKLGTQTPTGPHHHAARLTFAVYLYERSGYSHTSAARERIYALLHRQRVQQDDGCGCWEIYHESDVLEIEDEALNCSLEMARFYAIVNRE